MNIAPDNGSVTTDKIADEAVTNAKLRNSAGYSVIGRTASSIGAPSDIAAGAERHFLVRRPAGLIFDGLQDADIPSSIARDSEVSTSSGNAQSGAEATAAAALAAHVADSDPHPTYTTAAELASALGSYATTSALNAVSAKLPTVLGDYVNDAAAATGGVAVGSMYHTSGVVKIRLV
jgi:hypothetical protein